MRSLFKTLGGFSLVELVFSVALVGVLSNVAVQNGQELVTSFNKNDALNSIKEGLLLSQQKTIASGCRGIVTFANEGRVLSFGKDCKPYDQSDSPVADEVLFSNKLADRIRASSNVPIIFDVNGRVINVYGILTNPQVVLTIDTPAPNTQIARGTLSSSGIIKYEQ